MTIIIIFLILAIPILFLLTSIGNEIKESNIISEINCNNNNSICTWIDKSKNTQIFEIINQNIQTGINTLLKTLTGYILLIPKIILNSFIIIFLTFFFIRDGKEMFEKTIKTLLVKPKFQNLITERIKNVFSATIYGTIIIGIIQAIIASIGYWLFGIKSPLIWGLLTLIGAFIPFLGTTLIWGPLATIQIITGFVQQNNSLIFLGIGLLLYGSIIIASIDNVLKPKIIGNKAKIHPLIILIGVFGGFTAFGFIGILIGPVILSLFLSLITLMGEEL